MTTLICAEKCTSFSSWNRVSYPVSYHCHNCMELSKDREGALALSAIHFHRYTAGCNYCFSAIFWSKNIYAKALMASSKWLESPLFNECIINNFTSEELKQACDNSHVWRILFNLPHGNLSAASSRLMKSILFFFFFGR